MSIKYLVASAFVSLTLLAGSAHASIPCTNKVQSGVTYKCAVGGQCHLASVKVATGSEGQQECFAKCDKEYECKCALFQPLTGTCFMKTKTCDDPVLGVQEVPGGEFTALTMCYHCHKTPKWWVQAGFSKSIGDMWADVAGAQDAVCLYWEDPGNAACICTDQAGWICDFTCGDTTDPTALAGMGESCDGRSCASPDALCMYLGQDGQLPTWICVKQTPLRNRICRTYEAGRWDGDVTGRTWSCAWYPGRKICSGRRATKAYIHQRCGNTDFVRKVEG